MNKNMIPENKIAVFDMHEMYPCTALCFKTREPEEVARTEYKYDRISIKE